jgi:hypothetical protein
MRIAGNLDVEVTWARMDAAARRARGEKAPSPDDPRFALPEPVMRKISAAATLLRVFAQSDDDVLWTPRPVDPTRMPDVGWWMPRVRLESGPFPASADLWWGEPSEVAARVNHRFFAWDAKVRIRHPRLPGASLIRSLEDLDRAVGDLQDLDVAAEWVAKAPLSAAGRLRVRGNCGATEVNATIQARRLLELYGLLVFEPWMHRVADFGVGGSVDSSARVEVHGIHGLVVDAAGRFLGIAERAAALDAERGVSIGSVTAAVGGALRDAGYRGSFGVDGYVYRSETDLAVHCVSEINARMTFGQVANRILDMSRETSEVAAHAESLVLRFGRGAPPPDSIPLLLPGEGDDTSAWLETAPRHAA